MVALAIGPAIAAAQEADPAQPAQPNSGEGFRRLAPGIERVIDPESQVEEAFSWHNLKGLLDLKPDFGVRPWAARNLAKDVRIQHDIWSLQFVFKPIRFIELELPSSGGGIERKTVWYIIYHVKNMSDKPVRFVPRFLLHAHETDNYYPDRIIPLATRPIQLREDPRRVLLNNVEISDVEILPSTETEDNSVWGVTVWRDVDPQIDRFSIYVQGLSNAYKIVPNTEGDWRYIRKTLQLNFWRPGDEFYESEQEIRLGIPGDVDYRWVYK